MSSKTESVVAPTKKEEPKPSSLKKGKDEGK